MYSFKLHVIKGTYDDGYPFRLSSIVIDLCKLQTRLASQHVLDQHGHIS